MYFNLLVEGLVDEAVGRRALLCAGHEAGTAFGKKGWTYIAQKIAQFDRSCAGHGLLTLVDFMDTGAECPVHVAKEWLPQQAPTHVFRLVVREIESWVLADRRAVANFLGVPLAKVPIDPDALKDPKQVLINLARLSRSKSIREALVPAEGRAASEGPLYSSELVRFINDLWNPQEASQHSDSFARCLNRLIELHKIYG